MREKELDLASPLPKRVSLRTMSQSFRSFAEFYPFYLKEHGSRDNRRLHFAGMSAALMIAIVAAATLNPWLLLAVPIAGYGLSWFGHLVFERNKPATFGHPLFSLRGDLMMYREMLTGKI